MKQYQLFMAFFRVGMLGYGGGPASIPLVHKEVVEKYKWINTDEFGDILAIGNALPGPIATKMAGYIGYRVGGYLGMVNAIVASIVPTIILMIVILTSLSSFREQTWVQGMTKAVVPVVGVMMAVLTWDFFMKSKQGLGWGKSLFLLVGSFLIIGFLGLHPAFIIGALLLFALTRPSKKKQEGEQS
ncbi:chromate transporter [Anaerobacillus isosaccharinicus]|uniref:Chromate transporter n=1 Tax=Anaerobacillus isosaccharinicus TaxID=1532552 RepID=A0A1S2MEP1_9BACI|nr:chromate transporter [Anaerobacillus isosaccharinicus]MBA5584932.1 chromate transporter [Anaerobacillus isosaccharinicus]QOY36710.1 chromate transporter [Anaerobacillus isosaccharinicus]